MMFICNNCDYIFDEPVIEYDDPSPVGVALPSGYYEYYHCPKCYSESISEYWEDEYEDIAHIDEWDWDFETNRLTWN